MADLSAAIAVARQVIAGTLSPRTGCARIADLCHALGDPDELLLFDLLAHEQTGHEHIGIAAESLEPEIIQACEELVRRVR